MKKNFLLITLLLCLTSCDFTIDFGDLTNTSTESNSNSDSNQDTESQGSSSEEESSSASLPKPTQFIYLDLNDVIDVYHKDFSMGSSEYLLLDSEGRIAYGKDSKGNVIKSSLYTESFVSGSKMTVKSGFVAYKVLSDAYNTIVNKIKDIDYVGITLKKDDIEVRNNSAFRLSSIHDYSNSNGIVTYKTIAPYTDTYKLSCSKASYIKVFDSEYELISAGTTSASVDLNKDDVAYIQIRSAANSAFDLVTAPQKYKVELPYEVINDETNYDVDGNNPSKEIQIAYTKRSDSRSLYVNCNNPEALTTNELNKCLSKQDVTNKDVFFTFEHNNISQNYYYGYRVTNTSNDDIYVTVKNLGYQVSGKGTWLGEDEWVKFYNVAFRSKTDYGSSSANNNYQAYVGFANNYNSENRKPITYRIPKGKYIYVMGGTTSDAYDNINVFKSANVTVNGGCGNGAVLFSVNGGSATGQFVVYNNVSTLANNINKENGYVVKRDGKNVGSQYLGYDDCHGVVDCNITWIFNDSSRDGVMPFTYQNKYFTTVSKGTAYAKIASLTTKTNSYLTRDSWVTHINPNGTAEAVGTDMTFYKTIDNATGKEIIIDYMHYDGKGSTANIGNWMVDYQDHFTLVNQGNKDREFTYKLSHNGVILAFVRKEDGMVDTTFSPKYWTSISASDYGAECRDKFEYCVFVPAHSKVQFTVDYNLLANSSGYISHEALLGTF